MPDLFVDAGNTSIKAAVRADDGWRELFRLSILDRAELFSRLESHTDGLIVVSSVVRGISSELSRRFSSERLVEIRPDDLPSECIDYQSSATLGVDRFLTCYAASAESSEPVVVIDSGTACTIDIMTADGVYRGGVIMPGLEMLKRAMRRDLPALPDPDPDPNHALPVPDQWPGRSTLESVQWGTTGMFLEAIEGFLGRYRERYGSYELFVTGGGSSRVGSHLSERFEVKMRPHLMYQGMALYRERHLAVDRNR